MTFKKNLENSYENFEFILIILIKILNTYLVRILANINSLTPSIHEKVINI